MKTWFVFLLYSWTALASAKAGSIFGTVHSNENGLRDFVVYIENSFTNRFPAPYAPILLEVRTNKANGAMFSPHVLPVIVGTTMELRNNDVVYHNVFSMSDIATFDFGPAKHGDPLSCWKFEKPGRVDVFCSIHANENCIVLVMANPYYTGTDYRNSYLLQNIPAGTYRLKAWHERAPAQVKDVTVPKLGKVQVDFALGETAPPIATR